MNFEAQSQVYLRQLQERSEPAKQATLVAFNSHLRNHILPLLGAAELEQFHNGAMKCFIEQLTAKSLKPKSIQDITRLVRSFLASAVDPITLDPLYPRTWNTRAIGAPRVKAQRQPAATAEQIREIIHDKTINLRNRVLIATLAATGLRSGECLAIKCMPQTDEFTTWNVATATIYVRKSLWRGKLQTPKTDAGIRDVELSKETNDMLRQFAEGHKRWR